MMLVIPYRRFIFAELDIEWPRWQILAEWRVGKVESSVVINFVKGAPKVRPTAAWLSH